MTLENHNTWHGHNPPTHKITLQEVMLMLMLMFGIATEGHTFTASETIIQNNCRGCHGVDGKATVESWPNLACQNRGYLYSRLINLRHSNDHNIDVKVKILSLLEIDEISRYYSNFKCPN
jgi:cytochrome c553